MQRQVENKANLRNVNWRFSAIFAHKYESRMLSENIIVLSEDISPDELLSESIEECLRI